MVGENTNNLSILNNHTQILIPLHCVLNFVEFILQENDI